MPDLSWAFKESGDGYGGDGDGGGGGVRYDTAAAA